VAPYRSSGTVLPARRSLKYDRAAECLIKDREGAAWSSEPPAYARHLLLGNQPHPQLLGQVAESTYD
jgi:hypothetical protein